MNQWLVDSHVHLHSCFDKEKFFDKCFNNLKNHSSANQAKGILFLTQGISENSFEELRKISTIPNTLNENPKYNVSNTNSNLYLKIESLQYKSSLYIISGYQIVTKENLEVLSIGTNKRTINGLSIEETIKKVVENDSIPIIPWGFGKWYGQRGKIVNKIITKNIPNLFLGDNGGRSKLLPYPSQFYNKNIKVLPGSDPLPFAEEIKKPLSYGFKIDDALDEKDLWNEIKNFILNPKFKVKKFGKITNPYSFIKTQLKTQLYKG